MPADLTFEGIRVPIYEYQCEACNHKFEVIQKVSDELLVACPECKERKLRKLVTAASFRLKGTGWYATDFKDKKPSSQPEKTQEKSETADKAEDTSKSKSSESKDSTTSGSEAKKEKTTINSKPPKSTKTSSD